MSLLKPIFCTQEQLHARGTANFATMEHRRVAGPGGISTFSVPVSGFGKLRDSDGPPRGPGQCHPISLKFSKAHVYLADIVRHQRHSSALRGFSASISSKGGERGAERGAL